MISLRNSLRPVNRLFPEIIALCATFVSDADPKPIVSLTHVCRYWRRAIVSNPRNWAAIGSGWKRLVPLCLERAGAVHLNVSISVSDIRGDEDFLQALLPHTSRISHLSLTGYSSIERVADDLPGFFTSPMSNLTSLELEQIEAPTESFPSDETPAPPLFRDVSKLKSLYSTRTPLYPTVFNITSLVELKLVGYTGTLHFRKFIKFLHLNPSLETVTLDLQFAEGSVRIVPDRTVSLPQLRQLAFTCASAADTRGLLSCVSLRRGVHIKIQASQSNASTALASFLPSPPTPIQELLTPVTTIKYQYSPRWFQIFGGDGQLSFQTPQTPWTLYGEFNLFVIETTREYHVNIYHNLSSALEQLSALEALVFSRVDQFPGSLPELAKEPIPCPSLKTIAFFDCTVTGSMIKELEKVLEKRRDSTAARLYRVVIVNNTRALPDLQSILQLQRFVPCVDVRVGNELPDLL